VFYLIIIFLLVDEQASFLPKYLFSAFKHKSKFHGRIKNGKLKL